MAEKYKDEPQWIVDQILKRETEDVLRRWEEREQRLATVRGKEKQQERCAKRRRLDMPGPLASKKTIDEEAEFLLADVQDKDIDELGGLRKETRRRLEELGLVPSSQKKFGQDQDNRAEDEIKIYYTSRTHSQLTQFVSELRRPVFPPSIPGSLLPQRKKKEGAEEAEKECIKHVPLSSRQHLCINPSVSRLGSLAAINDRCVELQQGKGGPKCEFFPTQENLSQTHQFRDTALATVPDIEDLFHLGKTLQVCPYYASRTAIPSAEIVSLPYPLLLQKSARDALGIQLDGNIVVVDEAHNIMDAVSNVHAAEITMSELRKARQMLSVYLKRFGKKLKGENRVLVGQVARVVSSLLEWMTDVGPNLKADEGIVGPNTLLKAKGADQINLFDLTRYIQSSKLAYKIESYVSHMEEQEKLQNHFGKLTPNLMASKNPPSSAPVLHTLASFLLSLTHLSTEGRIFYEKLQPSQTRPSGPDIRLSYLLLSPAHVFSSIVSSARAVILAGGTMSPFEDYTTHLFPSIPAGKIQTLSCDHAIDRSNLCVWTLAGLGGKMPFPTVDFDFSFQNRGSPELIHQLGIAILNICSVAPDGVVAFFPSYSYLEQVVGLWKKPSDQKTRSIWERLNDKKCVLQETKGVSSDEVLEQYQAIIFGGPGTKGQVVEVGRRGRGALLLSVVGGKMSEGINFSDRLGRCVIMVGLPYPNIKSPEWKAKTEYVEMAAFARLGHKQQHQESQSHSGQAQTQAQTGSQNPAVAGQQPSSSSSSAQPQSRAREAREAAKSAARSFYENACMRAVNQSIGRAIRHQKDYAAVVLADRRFASPRIRGKLPGWMLKEGAFAEGSEDKGLPEMMAALGGFFRGKKREDERKTGRE